MDVGITYIGDVVFTELPAPLKLVCENVLLFIVCVADKVATVSVISGNDIVRSSVTLPDNISDDPEVLLIAENRNCLVLSVESTKYVESAENSLLDKKEKSLSVTSMGSGRVK